MLTPLNDRVLCYDGDSIFLSEDIESSMLQYHVTYVDELTPAIIEYNKYAEVPLTIKEDFSIPLMDWNIPDEYRSIDVLQYCLDQIGSRPSNFSVEQQQLRVCEEYVLYEDLNLLDMLRVIIYIVNKLQQSNCVWGVGRGSSTSSYILYLIGLHDIDCLKYDLDILDFLG